MLYLQKKVGRTHFRQTIQICIRLKICVLAFSSLGFFSWLLCVKRRRNNFLSVESQAQEKGKEI